MCSSCLLLFTALFVVISGQKDSSSNSVSTECQNYQISFSGLLRQFYTCCQTPTTTETVSPFKDPDIIANFQCKEKETKAQWKNETKIFNCAGQTGQKNAMERCTARWGWLPQDEVKPDCWVWSECFAGACEKEEEQIGYVYTGCIKMIGTYQYPVNVANKTENETSDSCPIDCCPQANPEKCQGLNITCTDPCCGQPQCCNINSGSVFSDLFRGLWQTIIWINVGVVGFIVLLNICCCCCCVCCARRCCKKYRRDKHDKHGKNKEKNTPV
ncbi:uncharacterized protein [Amphiura filiformis]|uniref:uncharacterized protein n=1 Tax=Amphiura filiformis TaxID=82378 RepID=UPI003B213D84